MAHKAQVEVITIVLITGIIISLVGTAYMWGMPLISKRTSVTEFLSAEDFAARLSDKIVEIANSGYGEASLALPKGVIRIKGFDQNNPRSPENNSVIFDAPISQPLAMGTSVVVKTNVLGENATYGEAEPRVINMSSGMSGAGNRLTFNIHFRELDTRSQPQKGYVIAVQQGAITGSGQVVMSYAGTEVKPGGAANLGDLIVTKIRIDVV
jgi:hypothetical protein